MSAVQETRISAVQKARLRALKTSRWCARGLVLGAFLLSSVALAQLAADAHIPLYLAWIWPLVVDGAIYQATTAVMALGDRKEPEAVDARRWFQWMLTGGVMVSVAANVLHAWTMLGNELAWWQIAAIAVAPPLLLMVGTHGATILAGLDQESPTAEQKPNAENGQAQEQPQEALAEHVESAAQGSAAGPDPVAARPTVEQQVSDVAEQPQRRSAGGGHRDPARVLTAKRLAEQETPVEIIAERLEVSTRTVRRYLNAEVPEHVEAEVIEIEQRPRLVAIESGEVVNG